MAIFFFFFIFFALFSKSHQIKFLSQNNQLKSQPSSLVFISKFPLNTLNKLTNEINQNIRKIGNILTKQKGKSQNQFQIKFFI